MTSQLDSAWYFEREVPFCSPFLCRPKANESTAALWNCMPSECRQKLEVVIALLVLLAFFTTLFNLLALIASLSSNTRRLLRRNPTMLNYSTYVVSMAVADLLVGAVVLPLITAYFYLNVNAERRFNTDQAEHAIMSSNSSYERDFMIRNITEVNRTDSDGILIASGLGQTMFYPQEKSRLDALKTCVGVLTHLTIFVSMFTLASASADRFYTSTNPISHRSITFSRSRFSRIHSLKFPKILPAKINRSTFFVFLIWILGLVASLSPLTLHPIVQYESIGYMFVFLSSEINHTSVLMCYAAFLSLPLLVTWLFSFLICLTLWRRKQRLKSAHSSKSSLHKISANRRKISETARPHVSISESRVMSDGGYPVVFEDESSQVRTSDTPPTPVVERPLLERKKRRPSSFDATLLPQVEQLMKLKDLRGSSLEAETPVTTADDSIKSSASFVAMRLLYRRSWSGIVEEPSLVTKSSLDVRRKISHSPSPRPLRNSDSPVPSLPIHNNNNALCDSRSDISRPPVRRNNRMQRRRSSVYRARELLKSKSFESNIAKTLIAVVVTISLAVLPLLTVTIRLSLHSEAYYLKNDVTTFIVAVIILCSNSFWNFVIYGARMPYFRRSVLRIARRSVRRVKGASCSLKISLFCRNLTRKVGKRDGYDVRNTSPEIRESRREMFVVRSSESRKKRNRMTF